MAKTTYTEEDKAKIVSEWYEAKSDKISMVQFVEKQQQGDWPTLSIGSLRNWTGDNPKRSGISVSSTPTQKAKIHHGNVFSVEIDLEAKFNEMYEAARPAAYLKFLQEQTEIIRARVLADTDARIQAEIARLQSKANPKSLDDIQT